MAGGRAIRVGDLRLVFEKRRGRLWFYRWILMKNFFNVRILLIQLRLGSELVQLRLGRRGRLEDHTYLTLTLIFLFCSANPLCRNIIPCPFCPLCNSFRTIMIVADLSNPFSSGCSFRNTSNSMFIHLPRPTLNHPWALNCLMTQVKT
ncbi:unnamed protein product [Cuscuta epithymum]|uniref:Uncharacterized protein n=1 Tax=Cuscuta epithymum TaxID=186058 RepID=A0AAV0EXY5_9ASTE|nr:unnamed protein product [Cuscuta epithymum]CAH9128111.1 unnamed protein product [Cuscuta epithymum]